MSTLDQREEARYRQEVLLTYRAWLAYLEAQQTILAVANEDRAAIDPFEGASAVQERADAAQRRLATLPADRRALFEAVYTNERAQLQRQRDAEAQVRGGTVKRADPDEIARLALTTLLEDARGLHRDDGRGLVPRGTPEAVKWLAIDLAELEHAPPSETDYQLAEGRSTRRRGLIVNLVFAALALTAIPILVFLLRQPGTPAAASGSPTGNGKRLTPWPVAAVEDAEDGWSLAVLPVSSLWPAACADAATPQACWQEGSFRPLRLCLPAERLEGLATFHLTAPHGLPTRVFAVSNAAEVDADLVIQPCAGDGPSRTGQLRVVEPPPTLAPGEKASEGFTLAAITVRGRGEDPNLPEGRLVIQVTVKDTDQSRDWVALAPTLRLADGSEALPSETRRAGATLRFDYLIADQAERFEVLWLLTGADHIVRYRATLEPPPTRDAVLRGALRVTDLVVTPSQQTMAVQLTLQNTSASPLVVAEADLGFQTQTSRRAVTAPMLRQPLAPDERRALAVELPLERGILQIGPFRYEISVGR